MVIMTSRYQIVTNTATQTATIVSESPILAWYQARIGDSDTIVTCLPTLDTIVAHNCQSVNRLDTIVAHNCNDAVWVGPEGDIGFIVYVLCLLFNRSKNHLFKYPE